ncbi:MAG: DNA recombination protein RmuC, partial [Spirochaetales bacterium]|nr:DNA recombination protein RmuC [Spirochaetales bacterium]
AYQIQMKNRVLSEAKDISSKYINPPKTTDFAILFLPTESLYAEILSIPGFTDTLQTQYRVTVAGPTTLAALINSLQMGFRTLAVEKRSHEVWKLFAGMKKQFGYFADSVDKALKSIDSASSKLSDVSSRTQKISLKLSSIELPEEDKNSDVLQLNE